VVTGHVIFSETPVPGAWRIDPEPIGDERGHFARTWDARQFAEHGLDPTLAQCSVSFNRREGTLRGMHYQCAPNEEAKLVRCTRGAIYDVVLDMRPGSTTYLAWHAAELTADNGRALFIPAGCAHGFQTLAPDSEVLYMISVPYEATAARGVRWDDPRFGIEWPPAPAGGRVMSARDATYPDHGV
jgi:dTDP-4-dehydrorhamnose 3,5-epimerase